MNHGLQSMKQIALTKMYIDQYYCMTSLKTKLIVCGTKERRDNRHFFFWKYQKAVSILPHETKALLELFCLQPILFG